MPLKRQFPSCFSKTSGRKQKLVVFVKLFSLTAGLGVGNELPIYYVQLQKWTRLGQCSNWSSVIFEHPDTLGIFIIYFLMLFIIYESNLHSATLRTRHVLWLACRMCQMLFRTYHQLGKALHRRPEESSVVGPRTATDCHGK